MQEQRGNFFIDKASESVGFHIIATQIYVLESGKSLLFLQTLNEIYHILIIDAWLHQAQKYHKLKIHLAEVQQDIPIQVNKVAINFQLIQMQFR